MDTSRGHGIDWTSTPAIQVGGSLGDSLSIPVNVSNVTIATLKPMQLLSALKVMQARGKSKLLSSPSVTTLDNHEANTSTTTTVYVSGQRSDSDIQDSDVTDDAESADEQESSEIINNSKKIASRIINGLSYKDD